uniref:Uncharacterized protein n=1 Tax=Archaeoglobus fulgidus TaxID=2234 RepID=A0A7J2TGI3_ARCFL
MNQERFWWIKDLLDRDLKIVGVYLALVCLRFLERDNYYTNTIPSGKFLIDLWKNYYTQYFGKDEIKEAIEAGETFIDRLFEHERALNPDSRNLVLDLIEREFYDKFSLAFGKYLRLDIIIPEFRPMIRSLLQDITSGSYYIEDETLSGSRLVRLPTDDLEKKYGIKWKRIERLISGSGLAIYASFNYFIFPASSLSEDTIYRLY